MPALLCHAGAAVSTSTKPDVLIATVAARSRDGEAWQFDPTGVVGARVGRALRWSPVTGCGVWDDALLMARAMVLGSGVGEGTSDATHLSPGEIAGIPDGFVLHLEGVDWELLRLTQAYRDEPWRTLTRLHQTRQEASGA